MSGVWIRAATSPILPAWTTSSPPDPGPVALQYAPTEDVAPLRSHRAATTGQPPAEVLVTTGSQQALDLLARVLCDLGDELVAGLRVGWSTGPPAIVAALSRAKHAVDLHTSAFAVESGAHRDRARLAGVLPGLPSRAWRDG